MRRSLDSIVPTCSSAILIPLLALACGGDDGGGTSQPELDESGTHTTFVVNSLALPTSPSEANALGLNIDGDANNVPDNQLGKILATLAAAAGSSFDLQGSLDTALNAGDFILLASVQATDLSAASGAGMWVYLGDSPSTAPCVDANDMVCGQHFNGSTSFSISADSPDNALVVGTIAGGKFTGGPGNVSLQLPLQAGSPPLELDLIAARAEVNVSASGLTSGRLGGAITEEALQNDVLPALRDILVDVAAPDCTNGTAPCCVADSTGELLYELFDEDMSCDITLEELRNSSLISTLLAPDVDLFDANGDLNPLDDGVKDSLSLGIGFTAVPGTFTPPTP